MKHLLCLFIALMTYAWAGAQDDPAKDLKKVNRIIASYNLDPAGNAESLNEAATLIDGVVKALPTDHKAWLLYGNTYGEFVNKQVLVLFSNPEAEAPNTTAVLNTVKGYQKALQYGQKAYEKKDAVNALQGYVPNLYYMANLIFGTGDYAAAYAAFNAVVEAEALIADNGGKPYLAPEDLNNAKFVTAVCAFTAEKYPESLTLLSDLKSGNYSDAGVYEYLYKTHAAMENTIEASRILEEGRKLYPNDKGLLFAEINDALAKGDLVALVDKLKLAMEAEPENVYVPTTLGNVYDQLYQKALADGDKENAHKHFDNAIFYINKALEVNPLHFDAVYMMGALEYNKAVELATEVNALADDYSKEGTKKYQEKQKEMTAQFDKALPHFEKAEQLNPNDTNTLLALREIYARKGDFDRSNSYKEKLERLQGD
jgi:tetratricopeptide (TPR) repeat protein